MPPDPERLFEQAEALAARPNREDRRRAVSTAYYAVFHFILTAAADMAVGAANRDTANYHFVYRSIEHSRLGAVGKQISASKPQGVALMPVEGFGPVADFARLAVNLREQRELADYDPSITFTVHGAKAAIADARVAIKYFQQGTAEQREAFLTLLLYKSR